MLWSIDNGQNKVFANHNHIAGLSLELIEITSFFEVDLWPSAGFRLDQSLMSG